MDAQKKNVNRWIIATFIMLSLAQLYLPIKMIVDQEAVVSKGKTFRFKVAPLDPNDPFRGKYITLRYEANSVKVKNVNEWMRNARVYVVLKTDPQGYAVISSLLAQRPENQVDYVEARIGMFNGEDKSTVHIEYPFGRFYMEETKAVEAEKLFLETLRSPKSNAYAQVYVREGNALIGDVVINGKSVKEIR